MVPVLPVAIFGTYQPYINLVYEFGGLKGVSLALAFHQIMCKAAQVWRDKREQLLFGLPISVSPLLKE